MYTLGRLAAYLTQVEWVEEAEALCRRVLAIKEARLETGHVHVTYRLHELARCLTEV